MDKKSIEYIAKALDRRIKDLGTFIKERKSLAERMEWELKHKKTKSDGLISVAYYEDTATKLLREANEKIAQQQPHLDGYVKARKDLRKEFGI